MNIKFKKINHKNWLFLLLFLFQCEDEQIEKKVVEDEIIIKDDIESLMTFSIDTYEKEILDEPKILGELIISLDSNIIHKGYIGIEKRGSSSQYFYEKKQYGVETWDQYGADIDVSLGGLPKEEDWIFYGPYGDKSLIRNNLIYSLSNNMGRYASRSKFMEIIINGDYKGVYSLFEKIKVDKHRVNISKTQSSSGEGTGYIIKIDKLTGEAVDIYNDYNDQISFLSNYDSNGDSLNDNSHSKIHFLYHYPKPEEISSDQKSFIQNIIRQFENALSTDNFQDPFNGYRRYIDIDSFVDFFILNELSNNVDAYRLSTFIHKDISGKLKMGPIWDFNLAFGNANYCNGDAVDKWMFKFNDYCQGDLWKVPFWWKRLLEDDSFKAKIVTRWFDLRQNTLSNDSIFQLLNGFVEKLKISGSVDRNFQRWQILDKWIWPNAYMGANYDEEIDYLSTWLLNRLQWIDSNIESL
ncbi:MAG: hypothetical protein CBD04_004690 [bacterium TMED144]|nr:MAG: hypothetical protein CBD04_004690 [bacterium TMED144]